MPTYTQSHAVLQVLDKSPVHQMLLEKEQIITKDYLQSVQVR